MIKLQLSEQDTQLVVDCLSNLPFKNSSGLIRNITDQANAQLAEQMREQEEAIFARVKKRKDAE